VLLALIMLRCIPWLVQRLLALQTRRKSAYVSGD
jgi:hypothetical protein